MIVLSFARRPPAALGRRGNVDGLVCAFDRFDVRPGDCDVWDDGEVVGAFFCEGYF